MHESDVIPISTRCDGYVDFCKSHSRRMTSSSITQSIQQKPTTKNNGVSKSGSFCDTPANAVRFTSCHAHHAQWQNYHPKWILQKHILYSTQNTSKITGFTRSHAAQHQNACIRADHDHKQHSTSECACTRYSAILTHCVRCRLNATKKSMHTANFTKYMTK